MSGILSRFLSGSGTDPLNQEGGMEGYLKQFNVNPYWNQFLNNGQQQSTGLEAALPQYTQGGQNPYTPQQPEQQQQQPQGNGGSLRLADVRGGFNTHNNTPTGGNTLYFEDGRTLGEGQYLKRWEEVNRNAVENNDFDRQKELMKMTGSLGAGYEIPEWFLPDSWRS